MVESDKCGMRKGLFEGVFKEMESVREGKKAYQALETANAKALRHSKLGMFRALKEAPNARACEQQRE